MQYCKTQATLKRPSLKSRALLRYGTQRTLHRTTLKPVSALRTAGFTSLKNRRVVNSKTGPLTQPSRLFLRNRDAIGTRTQAMTGNKTLESDFYYVSLIRLPEELCAAIDDGSQSFGRSRHFVLLNKTPMCDLQMYSDGTVQELSSNKTTSSTVKLTEEQSNSIWKFMDCPAYVYLYSACVPTMMQRASLESMILLPCWTSQYINPTIAWDVVEEYSSHNAKAAFDRFSWNFAKLEMDGFPYKKFSLVRHEDPDEQEGEGLISSDELLTDSFLDLTALENEGVDDIGEAEKCRQYLNSCTSEVWKQLQWEPVIRTPEEEGLKPLYRFYMMQICHKYKHDDEDSESSTKWQLQGFGVNLSSAPWLVLLVCMPKYVANVVHYTMAVEWKECFSIGDVIPTLALSSTMKQWESPNFGLSRMSAYGKSLLCIMSLLSKSPTYREYHVFANGIKAYNDAVLDTNNGPLGELLTPCSRIVDTVLGTGWLYKNQFCVYNWFAEGQGFTKDSSERPLAVKIGANFPEQDILSQGSPLGKVFKAFIGHYYLQHGASALWTICQKIGLVSDDPNSGFFPDSEEWQEKDQEQIAYKKKREEDSSNYWFDNFGLGNIYDAFTKRIGYTFRCKGYYVSGIHLQIDSDQSYRMFFDWCCTLGRTFMHQFFQSFMMQNYPEFSQTKINRIISDKVKTHLYIRLAFITDLPFFGSERQVIDLFSVELHAERVSFRSFEGVDIDEIKSEKTANRQVSKAMLGMVGHIAFDSGCSIPKFNKIMEPLLAEDIKSIVANNGRIPEVAASSS